VFENLDFPREGLFIGREGKGKTSEIKDEGKKKKRVDALIFVKPKG